LAYGRDWREVKSAGEYAPSALSEEGFIHLSTQELAHLPANAMYSDTPDLVLLWIDPARVSPANSATSFQTRVLTMPFRTFTGL